MKKTIAFVTDGLKFNGNTLEEKSIGGSESAMIYMATELHNLGNEITVYCNCDKPGIYNGIDYRNNSLFAFDEKSQPDVCIVSRYTEFLSLPIDSKLNILWVHDIVVDNIELSLSVADKIFCLSEYHKKEFQRNHKIEDSAFWITSNGYDPSIVQEIIPFQQKKNNYIYASRYERGLIKLLSDIWPKIVNKNPEAKLHLCGYNNEIADYNPGDYFYESYKKSIELIHKSKNIIDHGYLLKKDYYNLLRNCAYMIYPTDCRGETSCINAIEAQALGCLVVTTDDFALSETVKTNTKIKIDENYDNNFLNALEKYRDEIYEEEITKAKNLISNFTWRNVAESWDKQLDLMFIERFENNKEKILTQLEYNSDLVATKKLTNDKKYSDLIEICNFNNVTDHSYFENGYKNIERVDIIVDIIKKIVIQETKEISILDLGSYDGVISVPILKTLDLYVKRLFAYDTNKTALETLYNKFSSTYKQLEIINDNVFNIDRYDLDIDVVIIGELLEHIENVNDFLNKLMSLVKKKTTFIFSTPAGPWQNLDKDNKHIEHLHHFEYNDIVEIFKDTNIEIKTTKERQLGRRGEPLYHWIYHFTVDPNNIPTFYEPNYEDKFIKTRPYKKIIASMIVKNEEDNLSRCIKSFYNIVDDIVITDTGSNDSTKEIASRFTNNIYDYKWEEEDGLGDFSAARNYCLSKCDGDYILWMDADEVLINSTILPRFILTDYFDSILVKQKDCIIYDDNRRYNSPHQDRLFKNNGIYFSGVVHEYPTINGDWISKSLFQEITFIAHYGTLNLNKDPERFDNLIIKNYNKNPNIVAKSYYMELLCETFHKTNNISLIKEILNIWFNYIFPSKDLWLIEKSMFHIQTLYEILYNNNLLSSMYRVSYKEYEDELNNIKIFATSEEEFRIFFDIILRKGE